MLKLRLTPETFRALAKEAVERGMSPAAYAAKLLQDLFKDKVEEGK